MIFDWFRDRRRKDLLAAPLPESWSTALSENMAHYAYLDNDERARLQDMIKVFAAEKAWEGCSGQEITDEVKSTISGLACLLILGIPHDYFANVETILVYPTAYVVRQDSPAPGGLIEEGPRTLLGQAWSRGPVILSWFDALQGARNNMDGRNVVLHEFAHKLDLGDGAVDGVPKLTDDMQYERWAEVMSAEFQRLVERSEHGQGDLMDSYGATNAGEFFAVATECFFEKPRQMREHRPDLYDIFRTYYRQDTAARMDSHHSSEHSAQI